MKWATGLVWALFVAVAATGCGVSNERFEEHVVMHNQTVATLSEDVNSLSENMARLDELERLSNENQSAIAEMKPQVVQLRDDVATLALAQTRQLDQMAILRDKVEGIEGVSGVVEAMHKILDKRTDAFLLNMKNQAEAAQEQANRMADLVTDFERGLKPAEERPADVAAPRRR